ncbi:hypothetical protein C8R47DRAFT_1212410 [Mycena vitilis]|nr:hypothetical protein C8R47DRAFT_1212410 [Mycena vitilis]
MENLYMLTEGGCPVLSSMPTNDTTEVAAVWQGIGGICSESIPDNALDYINDVTYLTHNVVWDDVGRYCGIEPASKPDWYRSETPFYGWIPTAPAPGRAPEWFLDISVATPAEEGEENTWNIPLAHRETMRGDLVSFRDAIEALAEHPKYDMYTFGPPLFDVESLEQDFASLADLQVTGAEAKRAVLQLWGHSASWIAAIGDWEEGVPEPIVRKIRGWGLLSRPKRGFLVSLTRNWDELNFGLLIRHNVPVYYVWGLFESADARFRRLEPRLMKTYRDECTRRGVFSLWGDEIVWLRKEFAECSRYDTFLQLRPDPRALPDVSAPEWSPESGVLLYEVRDFDTWKRRKLAPDENWRTLDHLYHHILLESEGDRTTTVVFLRYHRKPTQVMLSDDQSFIDEEYIEPSRSEIRERFRGRCAPREGQVFDPITGVERTKPLDRLDEVAVQRFDKERFFVPPPSSLGGRELKGLTADGKAYPDTTRRGRSLGPRTTTADSEHSSERREEDSLRPMGYEQGWLAAMARPDHVGNYRVYRPSQRQRHPQPVPSTTPSSSFHDARSQGGSPHLSRAGSARRSASPESSRPTLAGRMRSPAPFRSQNGRLEFIQSRLARRADFLDDTREWASQITMTVQLWQIPPQFGWNMGYLRDAYLIISPAAEIRLRLLALMTPSVRFMRHVLELGIERGISFNIGLPSTICERYRPNAPLQHRATTKARLESHERRLEAGASPSGTHGRWLSLLGEIAGLVNARAIISRGGVASWIVRAHGYVGLVQSLMDGPSVHVTVYHGGANDVADDDTLGLRWDELSESDYGCIFGYVAGPVREKDQWMYPPDELLEDLSKHYYREWNPVVDDLFRRIKGEWDETPCRGKLRNRREWKEFFHASNHGPHAPAIVVDASWMGEGRDRLARAFEGSWNKKRIWGIAIPESFREDF